MEIDYRMFFTYYVDWSKWKYHSGHIFLVLDKVGVQPTLNGSFSCPHNFHALNFFPFFPDCSLFLDSAVGGQPFRSTDRPGPSPGFE